MFDFSLYFVFTYLFFATYCVAILVLLFKLILKLVDWFNINPSVTSSITSGMLSMTLKRQF